MTDPTPEDLYDFWHSEDEPSDFTPTVRKLFPELDPDLIHDAVILDQEGDDA
jgi:hypothetical protein